MLMTVTWLEIDIHMAAYMLLFQVSARHAVMMIVNRLSCLHCKA